MTIKVRSVMDAAGFGDTLIQAARLVDRPIGPDRSFITQDANETDVPRLGLAAVGKMPRNLARESCEQESIATDA
jgi:hypothetical protein